MQKKMKIVLILLLAGLLIFTGCQKVDKNDPLPPKGQEEPSDKTDDQEGVESGEQEKEVADEKDAEKDVEKPVTDKNSKPETSTDKDTNKDTQDSNKEVDKKPETSTPEKTETTAQQEYDRFMVVNDEVGYENADIRRFKFFVDTFSEEFAVIVDASSAATFSKSHIPKAINIPAVTIKDNLGKLSKDKNILVYGQNDKESLYVVKKLAENGFPYVFRLSGNYQAWTASDYPTERTVTQGDINGLKEIIANLPEGNEKEDMKERLRLLQANFDLQEPVKKVEELAAALDLTGKASQDDIDRARGAYETTNQLALDKEIDVRDSKIIERLAKAEALIEKAENQKNILEARQAIDAIETENDAQYARILVAKIADEDIKTIMYNEIKAKVRIEEAEDAVDSAMLLAEALKRDGNDTQEEINKVQAAYEIAVKFLAESEDPENLKSIKEAKLTRTHNLIKEAQDKLDIKNARELLEELGMK